MPTSPTDPIFVQLAAVSQHHVPSDYGNVTAEVRALATGTGLVDRSDLAKLIVSGADRMSWLQGQVTNDMRLLQPGGQIDLLVCTPTGQVVADCRLWDLGDSYLLLAPGCQREVLIRRLSSMIILEDVAVEDVSDRYFLLSTLGPSSVRAIANDRWAPSNALAAGGFDYLLSEQDLMEFGEAVRINAVPVGGTAFDITRIEDGIPKYGHEIDAKTLPQEMGKRFEERYISYTKGCYTGQETIMRIHSRGHTNRSLVGLLFDTPVRDGDAVTADAEPVGSVTSACHSVALGRPIALAVIKNEFAGPNTILRAAGTDATVRDLPFVTR